MVVINGKQLAKRRESVLRNKVARFIKLNRRQPSLLAIELSADPGSKLYLKLKQAAAERIGIEMRIIKMTVLSEKGLSFTEADAVFIQHPPGYDKQKWQQLADRIPPEKDVDCLTSENLRLIKEGKPRFLPATVKAVLYCLESLKRIQSLKYVILGRSPILGLPLSWYLKNLGADVTLLHSQSTINNLQLAISQADILISAIGKPQYITGGMVKTGVVAIDCGSPVGDMDFASVSQRAAAITPVPGGVGPLTVVSLMENVVESAYHASQKRS